LALKVIFSIIFTLFVITIIPPGFAQNLDFESIQTKKHAKMDSIFAEISEEYQKNTDVSELLLKSGNESTPLTPLPIFEPSFGTTAEILLSHVPKLNEETQLTFTVGVMPQVNRTFEDLSAQVILPDGFTLINGDLSWQGDLEPGETVQITSTIKAVQTGELTIGASVKGAFDYLYVTVSENDSIISRTPFEFSKPTTTVRTGSATLP